MWPRVQLRRLFRVVNGGTPTAAEENWDGSIQWATPVDLAQVDGGVLETTARTLTPTGLVTGSRLVRPGSLLLSTRAPIGYVVEVQGRMAFNQGCRGLEPRSGDVVPRFFRYVLASRRDDLQALGSGSTFMELDGNSLGGLRVPLPSRDEQRRIVEYLDRETERIEKLVVSRIRMIALLDERMASIRAEWWARWADACGAVPIKRLGARIEQGWSPQCDSSAAAPSEWGVLKTSAVSGNAFVATESKRLPDDILVDRRWQVRDGDLLVVRGSGSVRSVGAVAVAAPSGRLLTISDLLYRIRGLEGPPGFFAEALRAPQVRQLVEATIRTGAGQTLKLRSTDVIGLPVPALDVAHRGEALRDLQEQLHQTLRLRELQSRQLELIGAHRRTAISSAMSDRSPRAA